MNIVNLTPHSINIYNTDKQLIRTIEPSGMIARINTVKETVGEIDGIPLFETRITSEPVGLPPAEDGTIYIVSGIFRSIFDRADLCQPGELLRDSSGNPIGCIGLSR